MDNKIDLLTIIQKQAIERVLLLRYIIPFKKLCISKQSVPKKATVFEKLRASFYLPPPVLQSCYIL